MKRYLIIIAAYFFIFQNAIAQTKKDLTKNSNYYAMETPVDLLIKKYVDAKINEWQQQKVSETDDNYSFRVTETKRDSMLNVYIDEAVAEIKRDHSKLINWNGMRMKGYDTKTERFLINSIDFGEFWFPVPVNNAPDFKKHWLLLKFENQDFVIKDNKFHFAKLGAFDTITNKKFEYDSKLDTKYKPTTVKFDLRPIVVKKKKQVIDSIIIADIDINIPQNNENNDKTYVLIISNHTYNNEIKVEFSDNDGNTFYEYCLKTLGIPKKNIQKLENATLLQMQNEVNRLKDTIKSANGTAKVIVYYVGYGIASKSDKRAYFMPIDFKITDFSTAYKLDDLYSQLTEFQSKNLTIFIDASFNAYNRNGEPLLSAPQKTIKYKLPELKNNSCIFLASSMNESAYFFKEKQHGLFSYFLLKKMQETKGNATLEEIVNEISVNVQQQSQKQFSKTQTPIFEFSKDLKNSWKTLKLK